MALTWVISLCIKGSGTPKRENKFWELFLKHSQQMYLLT
jgi:hypothetical protein